MYEEFEDAKWAIRGNKSKDRQYNGQNKIKKQKDKTLSTRYCTSYTSLRKMNPIKTAVNSGAPEWWAISASLMAPE